MHQLFLEERIENGHSDPARLVKLKKRQLNRTVVDSKTGKSYMEKFVETPPERELACETSIIPAPFTSSNYTSESGIRILEINTVSPVEYSPRNASACSSPTAHEVELKPSMDGVDKEVVDAEIVKVVDPSHNDERVGRSSTLHEIQVEKQLPINGEGKTKVSAKGYESDDVTSEVDNYMDALASMESEMETDNEYRFNGNLCFLKADTHGADFDAHEEHLESRAQLSDSQSLGNFSTSDDGNNSFKKNSSSFSYPDTPSSFAENAPSDSDVGVKAFPSAEVSGAEIINEQSHELSASLGAISDEHVVSHHAFIKEESIRVHEDASRSPLQDDLYSTAVYSDPGASLSATSPLRTEGGTSMECITCDSKLPDAIDNGTYLVDFAPQVSSQIDGDLTATSSGYHVDESDAVLHLSNISEASEKENRDSSGNEVLQTEDEVENSNKNLVSDEIDSPRVSAKEKQLTSSLPDIETCSENYNLPAPDHSEAEEPGDLESKLDDTVSATGVNSEDLPTMVDTVKSHISEDVPSIVDSPQTPVLMEQQHPHFSECIPHLEPDLPESGVQHSKEEPIVEEISGTRHFLETGLSTSYVDSDGSNVLSLERPSRILTDLGDNDHADLDFVASRTVVVEDQSIYSADSTNVVDSVSNDICSPSDEVSSLSRNPTNLLESLPGFVDPIQNEVELDDGACPEDAKESETPKEQHQEEVASTDSGLNSSTPVSYDHSSYKIDDINDDLSPDERTQNSLSVIDITASSSLDMRDKESEIMPSNNYHLDDQEYAPLLPTSSQPVPDTPSEKSLKLRDDQVRENSVTDDAGSHPETPLEHSELRADQLYVSCLQGDQPSIALSSLPSEETEPVNHRGEERDERVESRKPTNQEIDVDASLESSREDDLPSQSSTSQFSSKSAAPEVGNMKQESNPFESALPGVGLQPEAAQVNLGEMPPMPPLPPMQWRMGKFQHAFLDGNRGLFLPIQPLGADEKAQVELPASQSGVQHPQSLFLPLTVIENEKSLHVSDPLAGSFSFAQPSTYSLQLPTMVNDANNQYNYLSFGGTQPLNPFLTLPVVSSERHGHGYLASEGEIVQPGSSSFPPTPTTQSTTTHNPDASPVIQPLNQQAPKEDSMTNQQSLQSSEGEEGNPFAKSIPPPPVAQEQVRLGLLMPDGGTPWSSNNTSIMPESEVGKPNGNPVNKLPRPRNPLIDAVNAHGKSKVIILGWFQTEHPPSAVCVLSYS